MSLWLEPVLAFAAGFSAMACAFYRGEVKVLRARWQSDIEALMREQERTQRSVESWIGVTRILSDDYQRRHKSGPYRSVE